MLKELNLKGKLQTKNACPQNKMYIQVEQANAISEVTLPKMKNYSADYIDFDKVDLNDENLVDDSTIKELIRASQRRGSRYALAINQKYTMNLGLTLIPLDRDNLTDLADLKDYELPSELAVACKKLSDRLLDVTGLPTSKEAMCDIYPETLLHSVAMIENRSNKLILRRRKIVPGCEWNQKQDIYIYNPYFGKIPKLVGKDLESFAESLDTDSIINKHIQQQLFKGRDANASEFLFKIYLAKIGYYLNPNKKDFETINEKAGLSKEINLTQVVDSNLLEGQY